MILETLQGKKIIKIEEPPIPENNAIQMELESFAESILSGKPPKVSVKDGYKALRLAYLIIDKINSQADF
jgi:predicted dehydrogenase